MRFILVSALVGALLIAILAATFALQNPDLTAVNFFAWQFDFPLALILFLTLGLGVIIGLLVLLPSIVKREMKISQKNKRVMELENILAETESTLSKNNKRTQYLEENMQLPNNDSELNQ